MPTRLWLDPAPLPNGSAGQEDPLCAALGCSPLVARLLAQRGLSDPAAALAFLDPLAYIPASPFEFPGMQAGVQRIRQALERGEKICVWGDFDVDGQTSTTILVSALRALGANVCFHIPVREKESHGIHLEHLRPILEDGVTLLLTCDTGISALEPIAYAQNKGVDVILTDHHEIPPELPPAFAIINPRLLPPEHALATLPGAGVAYELVLALAQAGLPVTPADYLDLAVLGLVADLATLRADARYLVQTGLAALRATQRPGLLALLDLAGARQAALTEEHISFLIAPRMNALGRLDDANASVEFLTTPDAGRARILAMQLEGLNTLRRTLTRQVLQGALAQLEREPAWKHDPVLVLSNPAWHPGVIGIVASQLVAYTQKPVLLVSAPPGQVARGSARSVEGIHITQAIASQAGLLRGFGGHPMAAGFALEAENIPEFRRGLVRAVKKMTGDTPWLPILAIDAWLELPELSLDLVESLEALAPFGPGNPAPVFASKNLTLKSSAAIGQEAEHLQMLVEDEDRQTRRVLWWQGAGWPQPPAAFDLAYRLRASSYRGQRELQIEWLEARWSEESETALAPLDITLLDQRGASLGRGALNAYENQPGVQIWGEAEARDLLPVCTRLELKPAPTLVVWSSPPGPQEWLAALARVRPTQVVLFGVDPASTQPEAFLKRLAGLVKFRLSQNGSLPLAELAAATAQRPAAVLAGLDWLRARGLIEYTLLEEQLNLTPGAAAAPNALPGIQTRLNAELAEAAAYRQHFRQLSPEVLKDQVRQAFTQKPAG